MTNTESSSVSGMASEDRASVSIQQMFDCNRIETFADIIFLCLYFPIGLCLFTIRLFIFVHVLLVSNILPKDSYIRSIVFRSIFVVLGIVIQEDNVQLKNFKAQFIISNRISDFDPLIVNMIYPCSFLSSSTFPRYISWLFGISENCISENKNDLSAVIKNNSLPVVCFPESSRTNGHVGLFKFETWPFACDLSTHLIFIEGKNPLFNVNISPLGASWLANLFWLFFLPVTVFNIRYLSSAEKNENESIDDYSKRIQRQMASLANLYPSNFDKNDKKEMMKRYRAELIAKNINKNKEESKIKPLSIDEMAIKVKEVLPQVPLAVIKTDIMATKNIDDTIERILNGHVQYNPEESPPKALNASEPSSSQSSSSTQSSSESGKLFYCGSTTFGKSAFDRSKSFQERKEHLFRVARTRYLQRLNNTDGSM